MEGCLRFLVALLILIGAFMLHPLLGFIVLILYILAIFYE